MGTGRDRRGRRRGRRPPATPVRPAVAERPGVVRSITAASRTVVLPVNQFQRVSWSFKSLKSETFTTFIWVVPSPLSTWVMMYVFPLGNTPTR